MVASNAGFIGPQYYDEFLKPSIFGPFAAELERRLPALDSGAVLELACGTGALTRLLRQRLPEAVELTATDLSLAMLDYARKQLADLPGITWQAADMLALPFPDGAFAAAACGFGLMFPPDRQQALREARRVLADGAPFVFSVWDGIENNTHALANAQVVEALFPDDAEMRFRTPYDMNDQAQLREMLAAAGFDTLQIESIRRPIVGADPQRLATGQILGTPRSQLLVQRGADLQEVIGRVAAALRRSGGDPYQGHAQALLVRARVGC